MLMTKPPEKDQVEREDLERVKRIMERLVQMPHKPHAPLSEDGGGAKRTKAKRRKAGR